MGFHSGCRNSCSHQPCLRLLSFHVFSVPISIIFLLAKGTEHFSMYVLAIYIILLEKC